MRSEPLLEKTCRNSRRWCPRLSVDILAWGLAIYVAVVLNTAFWRAAAAAGAFTGNGAITTAISLFLIIVALNVLLARPFCTRWTTRPVLSAFLLIAVFVSFFSDRYAVHFDVGMARNILATDPAESRELATTALLGHVLLYATLPLLLIWGSVLRWTSKRRSLLLALGSVALAVALVVASALLGFKDVSALMRNNPELRYLVAPSNILVSFGRIAAKKWQGRDAGPRQVVAADARLDGHAAVTRPHILVIVVGETIRAQNWGLNGYARQTTPQLATRNLVNYPDVTACGSSTEVSLPCMFSVHGRSSYDEQKIRNSESLLHVLARTGVKVLWRDNQGGCKGVCEGLPFESVNQSQDPALCTAQGCQDTVLLAGLKERLQAASGDTMVVLHQLGNHGPSYYLRYPESLRSFQPDCRNADLSECSREEVVNAYDNAILATDDLLARLIDLLGSLQDRDTAMLYISDHGESLGESNLYLHGLPYAIAPDTQIKVPMVAWISPSMASWRGLDMQCVKQQAARPASHDNLFHSVLGLMEVSTSAYERGKDVFGTCATATRGEAVR
ncbi:MAG TPA: phosphoethanolamine transferase [Xanthomonadaceae bacterium]|uniref:Phosphoethanolamine--lipid A transferase n=1 Tax=Pseudoxanthomonas winnipegensis TaxID=2480810 RepID=A0A4Q8LXF5_9GAMM|nr:phosphoethanolamine--lipid A transferase [Pseudoxanthomonas winnipegensis]HAI93462.1 phosphoethanolamine transferase [Xanthomonadaceae bacterium]